MGCTGAHHPEAIMSDDGEGGCPVTRPTRRTRRRTRWWSRRGMIVILGLTMAVALPAGSALGLPPALASPSRTAASPAATGAPSPSSADCLRAPSVDADASATEAPSQTPDETPSAPTITPSVIPMAEAWGDVAIHSIPTDLGHGRRFVFAGAATSDGEWLIGASQPKEFAVEGKVTWGRSDAVLIRVSDGKVRRMAKLTMPLSQLVFAASDGPWVVWMESDDNPYGYNWRLRVYDRETRTTRELAHALHKDGAVLKGPWPVPWVSHDLAVWGQAIGPLTGADPLKNAVVQEEDLRTGEAQTLADHAGLPAISWPWVAWGALNDTGAQTIFTNRETGQQQRLETAYHTLVLYGASAAYNTPDYHVVCLIDDLATSATPRIIMADPNIDFEWLTLNGRAVGFAQRSLDPDLGLGQGPTQVYDRQLEALVDLPMIVGFSDTYAVGPLVVWATPTRHWDDYPDFLQVVDTRDIAR